VGIAIGDGLTDPAVQVTAKAHAAYHFGLINLSAAARGAEWGVIASGLAREGNYTQALEARQQLENLIDRNSGINLYDVRTFRGYDFIDDDIATWANEEGNMVALNLDPGSTKWVTVDEVYHYCDR